MKILHTADWHIGEYPGPEKNGINLRGQNILSCLNTMVVKAVTEKPDLIVVPGDLFKVSKLWSDKVLPEIQEAIVTIKKLSLIAPTVVMKGTPNHDGNEQFKLLERIFEGISYVTIITEPGVYQIETAAGSINVAALPGFDRGVFRANNPGMSKEDEGLFFTGELGKVMMALRAECKAGMPRVLLAHYTVPGANMESGQTAFLAQAEPVLMPADIDAAGFDLVCLGHIHRPQQVESVSTPTYYSGAVNGLNFNDEGQPRGFYIHEIEEGKKGEHRFIELPSRQFQTVRLNASHIESLNMGDIEGAAGAWRDKAKDKIIRVLYTCTDEQDRAFDRNALKQILQFDGAFYVHAIMPENLIEVANKAELAETGTPEENLKKYFEEKGAAAEHIRQLLEKAAPIIAEANANLPTATVHGRFDPVSIEVTNYRSYRHECFNFSSISLCTVNGVNGAGKSSLFMDAPLDALFEETRENMLTGWISEGAKSGAIVFTFRLGDRLFRVTRTRTKKSSKLTLNIAEQVSGVWQNISKERAVETQKVIIDLLGMDSETIRSCAMIIQDGYGHFLQSNSESRMNIFVNLLGIGIYETLAEITKERATESERNRRSLADKITGLLETLVDEELIRSEQETLHTSLKTSAEQKTVLESQIVSVQAHIKGRQEAAERAEKLRQRMTGIKGEIDRAAQMRAAQTVQKDKAQAFLATEPQIKTGVERYHELVEQEKSLLGFKEGYDAQKSLLDHAKQESSQAGVDADNLSAEMLRLETKSRQLLTTIPDEAKLQEQVKNIQNAEQALSNMEAGAQTYLVTKNELSELEKLFEGKTAAFNTEAKARTEKVLDLKRRNDLLTNVRCVDIKHAQCEFLADAKAAEKTYPAYVQECTNWKMKQKAAIADLQNQINAKKASLTAIGFDAKSLQKMREQVKAKQAAERRLVELRSVHKEIELINAQLDTLRSNHRQATEKVKATQKTVAEREAELQVLADQYGRYQSIQTEIAATAKWLDEEKRLSGEREILKAAETRLAEIEEEIRRRQDDLAGLQKDLTAENSAAAGLDDLTGQLNSCTQRLHMAEDEIQKVHVRMGALNEKLESNQKVREQTREMQQEVNHLAAESQLLLELKEAFSRDGIPHNIVESILPVLTDMANATLAQMSGGAMRVRFEPNKILKSKAAKEVKTLDIYIDEGTNCTPYASKSGGEKVKASLAVILALSELKNKRTGVQLGMLFIDEPPFLDSDGVQTYCDALEAISRRDRSIKIMTMTHDQAMKARFPQSIDILKDERGSHLAQTNGRTLTM